MAAGCASCCEMLKNVKGLPKLNMCGGSLCDGVARALGW